MASMSHSPHPKYSSMPSDIQCSRLTSRDKASLPTLLYHPTRLFDPHSTPTIHLGPLAIPGPLLPLTISLVFIVFKFRQFQTRHNHAVQLEIEIEIDRLPPTPRQNNLQWPDLSHPDALRIYIAKANLAFHGTITNGAILHFGSSFLENDVLCCLEVVALLLYADVVKPETRKSSLAAAVGWTLFMSLDQLADGVGIVAMGLVVVLAAPIAWQIDGCRGEVEIQQSSSGFLLMLMAVDRIVFGEQVGVQRWVQDHPADAWKGLATLYVGNGMMMWAFNRSRGTRRQRNHWSFQETLNNLKQWMPVALNHSFLAAASLATLAGGIVCTAYLSSCLPWSRLMFGECASSPSLSGPSLLAGIWIYTSIFLTMESARRKRRRERAARATTAVLRAQLEIGADAIGWACLFMNALYVALGLLL
jgi:hypothetical protein